jgi:MoaA/NifB/PqqE/SkfB family radical SAM enzyme
MSSGEVLQNQKNRYRALWEFTRGIVDVSTIPSSLQLAKNNLCNFKCVYCVDHRPGNQIPRTKLEGETWQRLIELIPRAETLRFHGISEFMIDSDFFDIVQRCANAGATLDINTNGSVCTPKHVATLSGYPNPLRMNFSLDAADPATFLRIRGSDFGKIIKNVKTYIGSFESRRRKSWITVSFVITRSSVSEMRQFVYLAKSLNVDGVVFYRLHEYDGLDWRIEAKQGGPFDYRSECTQNFMEDYNRSIEEAREAAVETGIWIELPAAFGPEEMRERI